MKKLFLDIETLPAAESKKEVLKEIHQKRARDRGDKRSFEEYLELSGLDGSFGRIACIGYALDDEDPRVLFGDEKQMLIDFWQIAKDADLFIGFNILDFDLKFIYQRSMILGVKPGRDLTFARYRSSPIYDVMWEWTKWSNLGKCSLDKLAHAFGFESSKNEQMNGRLVSRAYKQGRIKEIADYCKKDVNLTRKIYKRMNFS
ncbi:hypothetical protein A2774_05955 [Candidatus Roizmanbacteria bacterium RIFCSPHIGHO2_01_FULL_39_12c]|uniref:Predicted 3'-5' exonuclease PolB-like domain-containing protein n=1 Tax=Candidatus Roizmanbacteria bacterium RIFCSPHIGHO2_01_FULL_39_12c TaxID=1802031 RepID=A0A1F7GAC4_9BACT|nr:MAG: hypothetical protein A2774_05955 [Candidatus Roizmanbacteria bacterium RIFCSPHIGHO2_01_FULL_39_12c]OGK46476.1 MAG: hypothetical protein A2963_01770 [Candidatus Roizmanbacteria bacterium RIFCSPLOWO2_01_FULL_40_13]